MITCTTAQLSGHATICERMLRLPQTLQQEASLQGSRTAARPLHRRSRHLGNLHCMTQSLQPGHSSPPLKRRSQNYCNLKKFAAKDASLSADAPSMTHRSAGWHCEQAADVWHTCKGDLLQGFIAAQHAQAAAKGPKLGISARARADYGGEGCRRHNRLDNSVPCCISPPVASSGSLHLHAMRLWGRLSDLVPVPCACTAPK